MPANHVDDVTERVMTPHDKDSQLSLPINEVTQEKLSNKILQSATGLANVQTSGEAGINSEEQIRAMVFKFMDERMGQINASNAKTTEQMVEGTGNKGRSTITKG